MFKDKILICDGAMGTMLQQAGVETGVCNEWLNITKPEIVKNIHLAYKDAGADIVITNTFGGNRLKLKDYHSMKLTRCLKNRF